MYKVGYGIDHHPLIKEDGYITLGAKKFASNYRIKAHSDGDLVLHALSNAILSAIGLDDIGTYFSDQDEKNENMDSLKILQFALSEMFKRNFSIVNGVIIVESDHIILKKLKSLILENLKKLLNCNEIVLHANRNEQRQLRISCYVTIFLTKNGDNHEK